MDPVGEDRGQVGDEIGTTAGGDPGEAIVQRRFRTCRPLALTVQQRCEGEETDETLASNRDMGRILTVLNRPDPGCLAIASLGSADPVENELAGGRGVIHPAAQGLRIDSRKRPARERRMLVSGTARYLR